MATAAYLSFTAMMVAGLFVAWRRRVDTVEALERAKADARRGRHAQALAADMANIAQALVLSFDLLELEPLEGESREAFDDARSGLASFVATLRAAQYLVQDEPMVFKGNAEGWVRVAVAGARGEGVGIRVGGMSTSLGVAGRSTDIARTLEDLVFGLSATLPPKGYVQIDLLAEGVDLSAPLGTAQTRDPRVSLGTASAESVGWTAATTRDADRTIIKLRAASPDDDGGEEQEDEPDVGLSERLDA